MRKLGKIITTVVILGAISGGYYYYKSTHPAATTAKKYVVGSAAIGTVISTIEGSGQVAAVDQISIKPTASGNLLSVKVKEGQTVKAGAVLFTIDSTDAQKTVRDAQSSLASAKLSYDRTTKPATDLDVLKAENSLQDAKDSQAKAQDTFSKSVSDGYDSVANVFLDLPTVMTGMQDMLYGVDAQNDKGQWNIDYYTDLTHRYDPSVDIFRADVDQKYAAAKKAYDANLDLYKATDRSASQADVTTLIYRTYETSLLVDKMVKSANDLIQFQKDTLTARNLKTAPFTDKHLTLITGYERTLTSTISSLSDAKTSIENADASVTSSARSVRTQTESLAALKAGADKLDVASSQLSVTSAENKLADARAALKDYTVTAPFDGIVAKVNVAKGDAVSSGTDAMTITTVGKVATVSLAEVDAAKVKVGQSATMTFDAAPDVDMTGKVVSLDTIGTISQGVVTYNAKISMDIPEDTIKPGMSVTAVIATASRVDVVTVPNGAIKKANGQSYVERAPAGATDGATVTAEPASLVKVNVTTGLVGAEATEILSGLADGDLIIARTATATTAANANASRSLFGGGGPTGR